MPSSIRSPWWLAACCLAVATLPGLSGCVQRRLTIRSNPPGATVYVDNVEIGTTPVSHDFIYYGTREIRLVKAGYETLTVKQPIPYAWHQLPPLDFFSDNLTPWEIRDERDFVYQLVPQQPVAPEEVRARGEELRRGSQAATAIAPVLGGPVAVPTPVPSTGAVAGPAASPLVVQPLPPVTPPPGILPEGATTQPGWLPPTGRSPRPWPTP